MEEQHVGKKRRPRQISSRTATEAISAPASTGTSESSGPGRQASNATFRRLEGCNSAFAVAVQNRAESKILDRARESEPQSGKDIPMKIMIQLEGFSVSGTARTYNFKVMDEAGESRWFAVQVLLEAFRATPLKFQDGPLITRERLQQELDLETQELHAHSNLAVCESDIHAYMERHYPPKARKWTPALRSAGSSL
jgi:hypothetical protein